MLAQLISNHVPTAKQGERILELLLTPTMTARRAYPLGSCPVIAVELPFAVPLRQLSIARKEQFLREGASPRLGERWGTDIVTDIQRRWTLDPAPRSIGTYRAELRQQYRLRLDRREDIWSWRPLSGPFPRCLLPRRRIRSWRSRPLDKWDYACSITVATEIVVVEASEAEKIALTSDPGLDATMRAAFSSTTFSLARRQAARSRGRRAVGGVDIRYHDLPAAVGFRAVLRLPDGREIARKRLSGQPLRARAGRNGSFYVSASDFAVDEPGSYSSTVVLQPDPEAAYGDPTIKAIWGGELAFPISFEVFSAESGTI